MSNIVDQVSMGAIVQVRDRLLEQQARGRKMLRLESGDPSFDIPAPAREAMEKALRDGLTHYTASTGIPSLREAIFRKVTTENGLKVPDADHVLVTNGGMHGFYIIFRALLEPGDEVILPDPMWTEIAENIRLAGGKPIPVRLRFENNYQYDPLEMEAAITPKTRAIFVNSPQIRSVWLQGAKRWKPSPLLLKSTTYFWSATKLMSISSSMVGNTSASVHFPPHKTARSPSSLFPKPMP